MHFVEVLPDGFQRRDHQGSCTCTVSHKQACQRTSLCFEKHNEGYTGCTVPQALSRFNDHFRDDI